MNFIDDIALYDLSTEDSGPKDIKIWIDRYFEELKRKKLSDRTIKSYKDSLNTFLNFMSIYPISIEDISAKYINRYLIHLQYQLAKKRSLDLSLIQDEVNSVVSLGRNDSAFTILPEFENTLSHRLTILKGFLKYISEENKQQHDFTRLYKWLANIKISERETEYITISELNNILGFMQEWACNYKKYMPKSNEIYAYRNAFLVVLYAITGARSNEIINVKYSDFTPAKVDGKDGYIILIRKAKGGKIRKVFAPKEHIDFYLSYLLENLPSKDYFISSSYKDNKWTNRPISDCYIREFSNKILLYLGIKKSGLHIFRRGYVSRRIGKDKVDVSLVAKEVGNTISILEKHYLKQIIGEE